MEIKLSETIAGLRRERGLSQKELSEILAEHGFTITDRAISSWERGLNQPSVAMFLTLCKIFRVDDIMWTFTGEHQGPFAGLNENGRKKARDYVTLLMRHESPLYRDEPEQEYDARLLPLYSVRVSAGTGNYLDESDYEMLKVPDNVPDDANYALQVTGDSMEPVYNDGQIIWVRSQQVLDYGDIGVFYYDSESYLKQFILDDNGAYLRSFNPRYEDIRINDNLQFRILGKVVAG